MRVSLLPRVGGRHSCLTRSSGWVLDTKSGKKVALKDPDNRVWKALRFKFWPPGQAAHECFRRVAWVEITAEAPPENSVAKKSGGVLTFWIRASAAVTYSEKDNAWLTKDLTAVNADYLADVIKLRDKDKGKGLEETAAADAAAAAPPRRDCAGVLAADPPQQGSQRLADGGEGACSSIARAEEGATCLAALTARQPGGPESVVVCARCRRMQLLHHLTSFL